MGFSKAYAMTGFRIGYACAPLELTEAMMRIHQYSMLCASIISQEAALEAIQHGEADTVEMRDQYRLRRNYIVNALNSMGLKCHLPRGSFYAFPSITSHGPDSKEFAVGLLAGGRRWPASRASAHAFGACGEGFVRCCFATALPQIEEAMERMAQ
jgi:aminotransferase